MTEVGQAGALAEELQEEEREEEEKEEQAEEEEEEEKEPEWLRASSEVLEAPIVRNRLKSEQEPEWLSNAESALLNSPAQEDALARAAAAEARAAQAEAEICRLKTAAERRSDLVQQSNLLLRGPSILCDFPFRHATVVR